MNYFIKVLQNYANFDGRARRKEFWMFVLFNLIFGIVFRILDGVLGLTFRHLTFGWLYLVYSLVLLIPSIAVGVRRMHDVGKSGWYLLIPIYNLVLYCTEGNPGDNEYGTDPKANG